jgi:hypothetical protein
MAAGYSECLKRARAAEARLAEATALLRDLVEAEEDDEDWAPARTWLALASRVAAQPEDP